MTNDFAFVGSKLNIEIRIWSLPPVIMEIAVPIGNAVFAVGSFFKKSDLWWWIFGRVGHHIVLSPSLPPPFPAFQITLLPLHRSFFCSPNSEMTETKDLLCVSWVLWAKKYLYWISPGRMSTVVSQVIGFAWVHIISKGFGNTFVQTNVCGCVHTSMPNLCHK